MLLFDRCGRQMDVETMLCVLLFVLLLKQNVSRIGCQKINVTERTKLSLLFEHYGRQMDV